MPTLSEILTAAPSSEESATTEEETVALPTTVLMTNRQVRLQRQRMIRGL